MLSKSPRIRNPEMAYKSPGIMGVLARDVQNSTVPTARLFQLGQAEQFFHRSSSSKVIGTASATLTTMPRSRPLENPLEVV